MTQAAGFRKPFAAVRIPNFLGPELSGRLLDYALKHETDFRSSRVDKDDSKGDVNRQVRISAILPDLGELSDPFRQAILALFPRLLSQLNTNSFEVARVELEMAAHGHGAFFTRHIDQAAGPTERMISAVYYFHAEPKKFSGGALRMHALVGPAAGGGYNDIEPVHDTLVVFPAWAPHEVLPVVCPSRRFADSRFAINCWLHRLRKQAAPAALRTPARED